MIVYPDGSVTGSVNVEELEEIHKIQKDMSEEQLTAIGPVESLAQLQAAQSESKPEPAPKTAKSSSKAAAGEEQ